MADRPDLPRIQPSERPGIFSREAGGWGLLGSMIGAYVTSIVGVALFVAAGGNPAAGVVTNYLMTEAGALLGAAAGISYGAAKSNARIAREMTGGRTVKDPTYLNSGIWGGLLAVGLAEIALTVGLYAAGMGPIAVLAGLAAGTELATGAATTMLIWGGASMVASIIGAVVGSNLRYASMKKDFDTSLALQTQQQIASKGRELNAGVGHDIAIYKDTVSREEEALLEQKQSANPRSRAEEVMAQRATQLAETERA